jgi:hypothetical protein
MASPCRTRGGLDTDKVEREITIGAQLIKNGAKDYQSYSNAMAKVFGEGVRPHTTELFIRSKALHDVAKLPGKLIAREKNIARRTEIYRQKIANRDFAREIREKLPVTPEGFKQGQDFAAVKRQWERLVEEKALRSRPRWQRIIDKVTTLSRWSKLTGLETMLKIGSAATTRIAQNLVEASFNQALRGVGRVIPPVGRLVRGAGVEGAGLAETPAFIKGAFKGIKEIPAIMRGELETYETKGPSPFKNKVAAALDVTSTRLHASGKRPAYRSSYDHAKAYLTKEARALGKDLSDPQVLADIEEASKAAGNRSIFLKDNFASAGLNAFVNWAEKSKQYQPAGYLTAKATRFLLPIVRVPTNIAGEAVSMSGAGVISAGVKSLRIFKTGIDGLSTAQKASIVRSFRKGSIGAGLFMIGYWNKDKFGGFFDPKNTDGTNLKEGTAEIGGVTIPKVLMHSPPMLVLQAGAYTAQQMENRGRSFPEAVGQAELQLIHEIPFVRELSTLDTMLSLGHGSNIGREAGRQIQGFIPQAIQNIAKWTDEHPESIWEPVARKPSGFQEQIMMGVPGLRRQVPTKEEAQATAKEAAKEKAKEKRASKREALGLPPLLEGEMRKRTRRQIEAELAH